MPTNYVTSKIILRLQKAIIMHIMDVCLVAISTVGRIMDVKPLLVCFHETYGSTCFLENFGHCLHENAPAYVLALWKSGERTLEWHMAYSAFLS